MPHLQELFKYCLEVGRIPDTWKEARLMVIPKEGENCAYPEVYHPITLLNTDYKILASILVE